jgi:hypothetical protein
MHFGVQVRRPSKEGLPRNDDKTSGVGKGRGAGNFLKRFNIFTFN